MNLSEAKDAVCALMNDQSEPFKARVTQAFPMGVSMFTAEYQWEFLTRYRETTVSLDADLGKYIIDPPTEAESDASMMFKPVVIWTQDVDEVEYIGPREWAKRQMSIAGAVRPCAYTLIGEQMVLDQPATPDTIYMLFTKRSEGLNFDAIPGQYRPAVVMAVAMWLTPSVLKGPEGDVANPAFSAAERRYRWQVSRAIGVEMGQKGRPNPPKPTEQMMTRSLYSR